MIIYNPSGDTYLPPTLGLFDGGPVAVHPFLTRPEEIQYTKPTRAALIHTLGGAWVDDWGEGVNEIQISGHTGYRTSAGPGLLHMLNLRYMIFEGFHNRRMARAAAAQDVDLVELYLVDTLNGTAGRVFPVSFQLRRHKSRPLLYLYQMRFWGLDRLI